MSFLNKFFKKILLMLVFLNSNSWGLVVDKLDFHRNLYFYLSSKNIVIKPGRSPLMYYIEFTHPQCAFTYDKPKRISGVCSGSALAETWVHYTHQQGNPTFVNGELFFSGNRFENIEIREIRATSSAIYLAIKLSTPNRIFDNYVYKDNDHVSLSIP